MPSPELTIQDTIQIAKPPEPRGAGVIVTWGVAQSASTDSPPWEVRMLDGAKALFSRRNSLVEWVRGDRLVLVRLARGSWYIDSTLSSEPTT